MNRSPAVEKVLLKRRQYHLPSKTLSNKTSSLSWERETRRGIHHEFGEYRLSIHTSRRGEIHDIYIQEDCSSIATRVWDCAVITTKWLEQQALRNAAIGESSSPLNLHGALQLSHEGNCDNQQKPIKVLELGSGMGLLSISLAKMGAAVMSTEYGSTIRKLHLNCKRNHVAVEEKRTTTLVPGEVFVRELDWYKSAETLQSLLMTEDDQAVFELIAVTDCSLSTKDSQGVLAMIQKYGTPGYTKVLVGLCREREGTPYFVEKCNELFSGRVFTVPTTEYPKDYQTERHTILLIQMQCSFAPRYCYDRLSPIFSYFLPMTASKPERP